MTRYSSYKRKQNRKTKIVCESFEHEGILYKVNGGHSGIYKEMLIKIIEQLKIALAIHKRLLVVRFDLHSYSFSDDNKEISLFRKQIVQWVARTYKTRDIGFVWARELEKAKQHHYHLAIWIDGDKIRHPQKLLKTIQQKWLDADPNHWMPHVPNPYYFVDNDEVFDEAVNRLSYIAKTRGKGYRPDQSNDYSTSRLKLLE